MSGIRKMIAAGAFVVLLAGGAMIRAQVPHTGQGIPPMPRLWDPGRGSWASLGAGPSGLVAAVSHEFERTVVTLRGGLYAWSKAFSGGDLAVTVGLPLSRGRLFASVGGGLGLLIGKTDPVLSSKAYPALAADFQASLRLSSHLGLGIYAPVGVCGHGAVAGFFLCLQYGGWRL
jgi:hypothetical protein